MLADKTHCTGCGSCSVSCPRNCIEMKSDIEGFRYPVVDKNRCVECRNCEIHCPLDKELDENFETTFFAAKNINNEIRLKSSSGGVFAELARYIIQNDGIVCAASYNDEFEVVHQIIESEDQIETLMGAKYSQSIAEPLFISIKRYVDEGRTVLFVGTPCQTAGLYSFLKKEYKNLLLVDMVCHGVPSPKIWKKYLDERRREDARGVEIISVNQRDKISGWSHYGYSIRIKYKNNNEYICKQSLDWYMRGFVNNIYLRPACSSCSFKGNHRVSDITIGDYWGVWNQYPEFDDNKGISLVMINTNKGKQYLGKIRQLFEAFELEEKAALEHNRSIIENSPAHAKREEFFEKVLYNDYLISQAIQEVMNGEESKPSFLQRVFNYMRKKQK